MSGSSPGFRSDVRAVVSKQVGRRRDQSVSPRESVDATVFLTVAGALGLGTALSWWWRKRRR